ncbi:MAG: hypothetical protein ABIT16_03335 [Croceibacterium sp.]
MPEPEGSRSQNIGRTTWEQTELPRNDKTPKGRCVFFTAGRFDPLGNEIAIDAYLRECYKTGDEVTIREGEYLARLAREQLK